MTDAWVSPDSPLQLVQRRLRGRFHRDLADAPIWASNAGLLSFELTARAKRLWDWRLIIARNEWFQGKAVAWLMRNAEKLEAKDSTGERPIVFAYSYAARDIFRFASKQGWRTVLGQIDPGPFEEEIVATEAARVPELRGCWERAPQSYWELWREECALADNIVVNSEWSRDCLREAKVSGEKVSVIPLAFAEDSGLWNAEGGMRTYPEKFSPKRPLRALFLGQINLRKGVAALLEAARSLKDEPVEFWMVGPVHVEVPGDLRTNSRIRWVGPVRRSAATEYYRQSDLFLFPTLSDGFGLTQIEALANHLPIIASRNCGSVVEDGVNGLLLAEPTADAVEAAIRRCINDPEMLRCFSQASKLDERFTLPALARNLGQLVSHE